MKRLASTKPMARACQVLMRELATQNGAAKARVSRTGTMATTSKRPTPHDAGSMARSIGQGHGNGAFQPPKNRVTVSAEMMKHVHVFGEEEEAEAHARVLGGEASHDLGVGLGQVERRPVRLGGRRDEEDQDTERLLEHVPVGEPAGLIPAIVSMFIVPASRIRPTTLRVSGIS